MIAKLMLFPNISSFALRYNRLASALFELGKDVHKKSKNSLTKDELRDLFEQHINEIYDAVQVARRT